MVNDAEVKHWLILDARIGIQVDECASAALKLDARVSRHKCGMVADGASSTDVSKRVHRGRVGREFRERGKTGEADHGWGHDEGNYSHHDHELNHDREVTVEAVAQEEEWVSLEARILFRDGQRELPAQGAFDREIETFLALSEQAATTVVEEGPRHAQRRVLQFVPILDLLTSIVDLQGIKDFGTTRILRALWGLIDQGLLRIFIHHLNL